MRHDYLLAVKEEIQETKLAARGPDTQLVDLIPKVFGVRSIQLMAVGGQRLKAPAD